MSEPPGSRTGWGRRGFDGAVWRADLVAGLCVAGLLLPEAVAYAGLAHLPVSHALIACVAGLAVYAVVGRSRDAVVAPTSSSASLAAAAAVGLAGVAPAEGLLALTLSAGLALLLMGLARQGALSAFVSRPVLRGFAFAVALTIVIRQLPDLLGLPAPPPLSPVALIGWLGARWTQAHPASWLIGLLAGGLMLGLRRWPRWPGAFAVLVLAMGASWALQLPDWGVTVVGPVRLPPVRLAVPDLTRDGWLRALELSVGLVVLLFAESWGSVRTLALRRGETLDADRELVALGLANVVSALLQGMPVGAGFSASNANHTAGARSRGAGGVALAVLLLALALGLPGLAWLPRPVLAVAVIAALMHALSLAPLRATWRLGRDRLLVVGAVVAVLWLGLLHGMLAAVALSVLAALRRFSQPVVHELAQLPGTHDFVDRDDHPEAQPVPGALVLRPQEPLFFASAERVMAEAWRRMQASPARVLLLSLEESGDLDSTALECLLELEQRLARHGLRLLLARAQEPVRALLRVGDPDGLGREDRLFWSVADAAAAVAQTA